MYVYRKEKNLPYPLCVYIVIKVDGTALSTSVLTISVQWNIKDKWNYVDSRTKSLHHSIHDSLLNLTKPMLNGSGSE